MTPIDSTLAPHEREIEERFVRASGPGGQNVNKVATAVELRFDVGASSLPQHVKSRLSVLAGSRMTIEGVLVLDSREYRTQGQNRVAAEASFQVIRSGKEPPPVGHELSTTQHSIWGQGRQGFYREALRGAVRAWGLPHAVGAGGVNDNHCQNP